MSGGPDGTGGGGLRLEPHDRIALVAVTIGTLLVATVNALTVADDFAGIGDPLDPWEPWVWELTSAAFWILAAIPLLRLLRRLRPPHLGWPLAIGAFILVSIPVCAAHIGFLAVTRTSVYALLGSHYAFDFSRTQLIYEWRKDLLSVFVFAGIGFLIDRLTRPETSTTPNAPAPFRFEVRDGARTRWFTATEIERVEAAGNYVELHTPAGAVLHRATLAAVAGQLAPHGFARIHRSRIVRRTAITALATTPSGDFEATLASGATVVGSRRFRGGLASAD